MSERESRLAKVQKKHVGWGALGTFIAAILAYPGIESKLEGTDEKLGVAYAVLQKEVDHLNDANERLQNKVDNQNKILILMYGTLRAMGAPIGGGGWGVGMRVPGAGLGGGFGFGGSGGMSYGATPLGGAPAAPDVDTDSDTYGNTEYDAEEVSEPVESAPKRAKKASASTIEELLMESETDDDEERPELPDDIDSLVQAAL